MTTLIERGHNIEFIKSLDMISFQSLVESSERVCKATRRWEARQQLIASQGTAKAFKDLMKELKG